MRVERSHLQYWHTHAPSQLHQSQWNMQSGDFSVTCIVYVSLSNLVVVMPLAIFHSCSRRQRSGVALSRSKQALLEISSCPDKSNLLDQIFMFIGSKPEEAVGAVNKSYTVKPNSL